MEVKMIGLCIVYKNKNYGSMLQSYATLIELQKLGMSYEIIRYSPVKNMRFYFKSLPRLLNKDMAYSKLRILKKKAGMKRHPEFGENEKIRGRKFQEFTDKNFRCFSEEIRSFDRLCKYAGKYATVLVGSDQLWLPSGLATNFYNLKFVPEQIRKVAYAASFGVGKIPFYQKKRTREYLSRIDCISVREYSGQRIIKELTGRDVPVIADPTLVIDRETWDACIQDEQLYDMPYIFCYFLGRNALCRRAAERLSAETGMKIITLKHLDEYVPADEKFGDESPYGVGPEQFVNLIRHAEYICTDSFHGSVFSIIYHKQFIAFNRYEENSANSRNSRLDTLFGRLGIDRRYKKDIIQEMTAPVDYDEIDRRLESLRNEAEKYLIRSLMIKGEKDD